MKPGAESKRLLTQLARDLLNQPEILAITFLDLHKHVITQASKPIQAYATPFSLQMPILSNRRPVGWIRAWYEGFSFAFPFSEAAVRAAKKPASGQKTTTPTFTVSSRDGSGQN